MCLMNSGRWTSSCYVSQGKPWLPPLGAGQTGLVLGAAEKRVKSLDLSISIAVLLGGFQSLNGSDKIWCPVFCEIGMAGIYLFVGPHGEPPAICILPPPLYLPLISSKQTLGLNMGCVFFMWQKMILNSCYPLQVHSQNQTTSDRICTIFLSF